MFVSEPKQRIGQQFGNYRLIEFLKGGGFGLVYKAELAGREEIVALNRGSIDTFRREAAAIASFTHPHIIEVYAYDVLQDIPFIVMPFIEQGSLRMLHPCGSTVDPATILSYVKQIASALQYVHDNSRVHRDVKPDNFLLGPQGVLLSDFGLAITAHSVNSLSPQDGLGTLSYMAPEQYEQKAQVWSDQYALAVVVYEWLCGKVPFEGKDDIELYLKHKQTRPPSFKQQGVDVPPAVEKVVMKGLAKNPRRRYTTVTKFARQLEQAILAKRPDRRTVIRNILLIVFILLIIASAAYFSWPPICSRISLWGCPVVTPTTRASPTPDTDIGVTLVGGEQVGISDGSFPFDTSRTDGDLKMQAADSFRHGDLNTANDQWNTTVQKDSSDAEALIYRENQRAVQSGSYITVVVGTILTGDW